MSSLPFRESVKSQTYHAEKHRIGRGAEGVGVEGKERLLHQFNFY